MRSWKDQNELRDVKSWRVERGGVKVSLQDAGVDRKRKWGWDK